MVRWAFPLQCAVCGFACFLVTSTANAADPDLAKALERLAAAAERETSLSPEFRAALGDVVAALRDERSAPSASGSAKPRAAGFLERLRPYGDARIRYEYSANRPGREARNRVRTRLRLGTEVDLHPDVVAGFRVRTGNPDDPNSPHQTLGNFFDSFEFNLDRLYLRYRPHELEGLSLVAGKFAHPFVRNPVYGELLWDADINPEGAALGMRWDDGGSVALGASVAEYLLLEQNNGDEASLFALQGSGQLRLANHWKAQAALGWYAYANLQTGGSTAVLADNAGNLLVDRNGDGKLDQLASEFRVLNPIASVTYEGEHWPVTVSGEFLHNTRAVGADDNGYAVGVSVGRAAARGDWRAFYQWQRIEQEAVFSGFAQDDFLLATNFRGHVFGVDYRLTDRIGLRAWGLTSRALRRLDDKEQLRLRLDLNASF